MNLNSLEYLDTVIRTGSFTKAARSIPISHQGIIKAIRHLEDEVGLKLLTRSGGKMKPTEACEALLPEIRAILDSNVAFRERAALLRAAAPAAQRKHPLFITPFIAEVLFRALPYSVAESWHSRFTVLEVAASDVVSEIEKRPGESFALVNTTAEWETELVDSGLVYEKLFTCDFAIAANRSLLPHHTKKVSPETLSSIPIALMNEPLFNASVKRLLGNERPANAISHISSMEALFRMARNGEAAVVTDSLTAYARKADEGYSFYPIDTPTPSTAGLLFEANLVTGSDLQQAISTVRTEITSNLDGYIEHHRPA